MKAVSLVPAVLLFLVLKTLHARVLFHTDFTCGSGGALSSDFTDNWQKIDKQWPKAHKNHIYSLCSNL